MKTNLHKSRRIEPCVALMWLVLHCQLLGSTVDLTLSDCAGPNAKHSLEGYAVWYRVPVNSLAHRRAQGCEFTAAHNRLPMGTLVRVTRLSNGCSVLVRITDRGITNRRANIDLCKEAAEELGMIREGFSRVRLEIVPELPAASGANQNQVAAH